MHKSGFLIFFLGLVSKDSEGKLTCQPIFSRIVSLFAEQNDLMYAVPGGLIGVGTKVDPTLCRADRSVTIFSRKYQIKNNRVYKKLKV